ncbi:hypothetical protein E3N88_16476 [Mikania micrantha]|uniref:Reverse transcriptase Ty1/copia-type domain-containing protein n=1 Tax=Mikania micrantha TaxID=192012 RepID=A0A5N6P148_9ASTR|nr:hypothetical protein E3N88_16476 [Mikania micrantha]
MKLSASLPDSLKTPRSLSPPHPTINPPTHHRTQTPNTTATLHPTPRLAEAGPNLLEAAATVEDTSVAHTQTHPGHLTNIHHGPGGTPLLAHIPRNPLAAPLSLHLPQPPTLPASLPHHHLAHYPPMPLPRPVVKPATIRTVLSLAISRSWPIHQLDVKNAFLHGHLNETVFMHQPPGFHDKTHPNFVCRLKKSLYGLKQAPRAWYTRFASHLLSQGFRSSVCDPSLFIYSQNDQLAYLLLYVDDIVLTASSNALLSHIIAMLSAEFAMTDLGQLHHFLGIKVTHTPTGLFLDQSQYTKDILSRASMTACKPCSTPVDSSAKLSALDGPIFHDPSLYRSLAGALQYLTFTRPDITYAVQQICLFMHQPHDPHFAFLKRVLRYLQGTIDYGIRLTRSTTQSLVAYSDADWAGCPDSRRSTSGYCVFLGDNIISWSSKRQSTISRSSAEAEYRGVSNAVAETTWLRNLLLELHIPLKQASVIYCDNVSTFGRM